MIGTKAPVPVLFVAAVVLAACAGGSAADGLPTPGAGARAVQLVGYEVHAPEGTWLGEVVGVLADPQTGEVAYLVLLFKDPQIYERALMAVDPRRFIPIPWARFTPGAREGTLNLDASEATLIAAPYLERPPASLDTTRAQAIDGYWRRPDGEENHTDFESDPR